MSVMAAIGNLAGVLHRENVFRNLSSGQLAEQAIRRGEAEFASNGALAATTGKRTGRSPKDKFIVKDAATADKVAWGTVNQPFSPPQFEALYSRVIDYLGGRDLFVQDLFAGADPKYRLPIQIITEYAWHSMFVKQLFVRPSAEELRAHQPEFIVIGVPEFLGDPARDGLNSEAFIITDFTHRIVLIGGTKYAGELKKSIFGVMNFILPQRDVFPMHCSANIGADGVSALFFGLSGTGKTTLSADPARGLIGDDEHGWSASGVFNFEGGCYAKCIRLSEQSEPQIYKAIRFGAVLENVVIDAESRTPDYNSEKYTENTRAAYPIDFIDNAVIPGVGGHPQNVIFLTADAFGVLPPISRLTPEQAMYHFMSGYTAKLAGTEAGVGKEPQPNFSTCFGAPFLPLPPKLYAEMLGNRLKVHNAQCWLMNTGWVGGPYGIGTRMKLPFTRAMVRAALNGDLKNIEYEQEAVFGLRIPKSCPEVPSELLNPRSFWADKTAYDKQAEDLAARFRKNFEKFEAPAAIRNAAPKAK